MNLASKLDRLRGRPDAGRGQVESESTGADALAERLKRLRRNPNACDGGEVAFERLRAVLKAEGDGSGLLWRDHRRRLPAGSLPAGRPLWMLPEVCGLSGPDWVFIDTETTGLSGGVGNLAFIVGVARYGSGATLLVRQFLLGNFAAERAMLRALLDWIGTDAVLVSYNGKCFDLPLLTARLKMHRLDAGLETRRHLDLMYAVRRAHRHRLPDCRLQTTEQRLLGIHRRGDLPGAEAPAAWRAWLERGATAPLEAVLVHNLQDVVSLALLQRRLVEDYAGGAADLDHAGIARAWLEAGRAEQARRVLESAGDALDRQGRLQLAALYRRSGDWTRAEAVWCELHRHGCSEAASELSKYYEHRVRDYRKAIGFADECEHQERSVRLARLRRKIGENLPLPW